MASECRMPRVENSKGPCFNCGEVRHITKICPTQSVPAKMVRDLKAARGPPAPDAEFFGCVTTDAEGFKNADIRPRLKAAVMSYFPHN